jgi:hypothetical protein
MSENVVAQQIVDAAYRVHTALGPDLLESLYQATLTYELENLVSESLVSNRFPLSMRWFASIPVSMPTW